MIQKIKHRWHCRGGYREVLVIAIPLILSTSAWSIQHFIDRMYLTWYSPETIAACMPASILNFTLLSFFIGTASYVGTFVAQYFGAKMYEQIGKAVWQGIYFSLIAMLVLFIFIPLSDPIFEFVGHDTEIRKLESQYFMILCMGAFFPVASSAISGFFSGLGHTWTVMWVNSAATVVNVILDYLLIFGNGGFPEMGIQGAAIATVISMMVSFALFFLLMCKKNYRTKFGILKGTAFDTGLFKRLWKFGSPNGAQFMIDMLGFTIFLLLVGRYGKIELAATNIAFNINMAAFMPMIGCGIAVSIMVGQRLGEKKPDAAEFATWSAAHICFLYMASISICYVFFPRFFLSPFGFDGDPEIFKQISDYGIVLLRFIAFYSLFDTFVIVFSSAIKGAGDTKFVMKAVTIVSWLVLVIPTYLAVAVYQWNLFAAWAFASAYISILGVIFFYRFIEGKWKKMLVIEKSKTESSGNLAEATASK